jgi:NPH3 family
MQFPLLSKSARLQKIVATTTNDETKDEVDVSDIPGGPSAFEICAKFCYGMVVTLNAYNVIAARCAAEYLEMHEMIEKGNLIYKIDVFLNSSILRTWKDSIIVLHTTKNLMPWAEELKIVSHCVDSIANKASIDPSEVEWSYTYNRKKLSSENGPDSHWNGVRKQASVPGDWWVEDICELEMDSYKRVIAAIKVKGRTSGNVLGEALKAYAYRKLHGLLEGSANNNSVDVPQYRNILETVVWLLPGAKGSVSCGFLLKLLRAACLLDVGENCRSELVKRVGRQLENASMKDLLIPAETQEEGSMVYDVDMVVGIVEEFMTQKDGSAGNGEILDVTDSALSFDPNGVKVLSVATLIDGCLAEIAKDTNLPLLKFVGLAEMISTGLRPVHDGLYRAIDMYLKVYYVLYNFG